tara:strand:+ start:807 stop:1058 length:252 start_codon:yes stop_codon:yes gene_type:complete
MYKRYNTAEEYLNDSEVTESKHVAWPNLEHEEMSSGFSAYEHLEDVPSEDPRGFFLDRRALGLTREDAMKVFNLWRLDQKFSD